MCFLQGALSVQQLKQAPLQHGEQMAAGCSPFLLRAGWPQCKERRQGLHHDRNHSSYDRQRSSSLGIGAYAVEEEAPDNLESGRRRAR